MDPSPRLKVIVISGPINAGKSTVARLLALKFPGGIYVDGDDLAAGGMPLEEKIPLVLDGIVDAARAARGRHIFVAYPLRSEDWRRLERELGATGIETICVTLAPPIAVALSDRPGRSLSEKERRRIHEMYDEGYYQRPFSRAICDNGEETPEQTAESIFGALGL